MTPPRVVVLRPLGLGDFLTGVPAYRALARAFPEHRRVLAAPRELHPLLALLDGAFDGAHDVEPLVALPQALHYADVAVDLHGRGPASQRILDASRPARLISFAHPDVRSSAAGAPWHAGEHEVARWCRMLAWAGMPADSSELDIGVPVQAPPEAWRGATVVHPGAASASRQWPIERWAEVVRDRVRRGERLLLTGGAHERAITREIAARSGLPTAQDLAGRTSLLELAGVVAFAARVVCGDTGVAHLATAYRKPSVVLFGPVPPAEWGPPPRPQHRALWAGRCGDPHGTVVDAGLLAIESERVVAELDGLPA